MSNLSKILQNKINDYIHDPSRVRERLREIRLSMEKHNLKKKDKWLIEWEFKGRLLVIGDIHGDMDSLNKALSYASLENIEKDKTRIVFLGDYVDRGPAQLEVLLSVLELWSMYNDNISVLRGNHEPPRHLIPYPHDFPQELILRYGYNDGIRIYEEASRLFEELSLSLVVNNELLCLHGGLPTLNYKRATSLEEYLTGKSGKEKIDIITEILWNDPIDETIVRAPSPRGAGFLWGLPVSNWVRNELGIKMVVRGHEPASNGYKMNHNGFVLTLFSRKGAPYNNDVAAILSIDLSSNEWLRSPLESLIFI